MNSNMPKVTVTYQSQKAKTIVADFYESQVEALPSKKCVILSQGLNGTRSESGRFKIIAEKLNEAGYNVLVYDYTDRGESEPDPSSLTTWKDDLLATISYAKFQLDMKEFSLLGFSTGALISLMANAELKNESKALVLWAPLIQTKPLADFLYSKYDDEELTHMKEHGYLVTKSGNNVHKEMMNQLEIFDWPTVIENTNLPALLIHGQDDTTIPISQTKESINLFTNKATEMVSIPKCGHAPKAHSKEFQMYIKPTVDWFKEFMPP